MILRGWYNWDCLFILSRKGTLRALCNATERELREGHNLEKMHISGELKKDENSAVETRGRSRSLLIKKDC